MSKDQTPSFAFITPRSVFKYPRLTRPDTGTKQYPQKPNYNVTAVFKAGQKFIVGKHAVDFETVIEKLEAVRDEEYERILAIAKEKRDGKAIKKLHKADVFKAVVDDEGNETGELSLRAKTYAEYEDRKTGETVKNPPPPMADASGKAITKLPPVGAGTEGKVGVTAKAYYVAGTGQVGVTFYLNGTQILKLVKYTGGKGLDSIGFQAEDGYVDDGDDDDDDSPSSAEEDADEPAEAAGGEPDEF